jgi:ParB/RepB/Spo0J family partition protein
MSADAVETPNQIDIAPSQIDKNPHNPRRFFNDNRLDLLRTSIQEVGVLVPVIVYRQPDDPERYVLMDGERRWISAIDLGLRAIPANVIPAPSALNNLLRMFNIHAVREDWPLVSVALSLNDVIRISGEERESRLAAITGLTRSEVRRAKRLLSLPALELDLIQSEAHLDRAEQVHREDLYLEIQAAESVLRNSLPDLMELYPRDYVIRQFAKKREIGSLTAVTDFRAVGRLLKAVDDAIVTREQISVAVQRLIEDETLNPAVLFEDLAAYAYEQQTLSRKAELLVRDIDQFEVDGDLSPSFVEALRRLHERIRQFLDARG